MEFSYGLCDKQLSLEPRMGLNMNSRSVKPTEENNTPFVQPPKGNVTVFSVFSVVDLKKQAGIN